MSEKSIRKHVASGELSQRGLEYSCKVCQQSLGQQPLPHINGASHKNKVFLQVVQNPSRYSSLYSGLPGVLTQALKKGVVRVAGPNLECVPCGNLLSGEAQVMDHLKGQKHAKQIAEGKATPQQPPPRMTSDSAGVLPKAVRAALSDGTIEIVPVGGIKTFRCTVCNSSMTGDVPLQQHLTGTQHRKTVKDRELTAIQQQQRPGPAALPPSTGLQPSTSGTYGPSTRDDIAPRQFRVNTMVAYHRPHDAYSITTSPKGLVVIFNYTFRGARRPRLGAEVNEANLESVFQQMNYKVVPHRDCSKQQTLQYFRNAIKAASRYSVFIAFFLSHGNSADTIQCDDNRESSINIQDLYMQLTDSNARCLAGKPKILMFNYCRGPTEQTNIRSDDIGTPKSEAPRHLALVQAALPQFTAKRDECFGTIFVQSLCEILEQHACQLNLQKIIRLTSQLMQNKGGTTATVLPIDFDEFFFL